MNPTDTVLFEVRTERERQDQRFGVQDRSLPHWISILLEEAGEAAQHVNDIELALLGSPSKVTELRTELLQVAAVAVAAVENIDRRRAQA